MGMKVNGSTGLTFPDTTTLASAGQASVRAWVNFNGTGTVAIRAAYNVSSITDNGTGSYTVNFSTAMSDANYSAVGSTYDNGVVCFGSPATSSLSTITRLIQGSTGPVDDYSFVFVAIFR